VVELSERWEGSVSPFLTASNDSPKERSPIMSNVTQLYHCLCQSAHQVESCERRTSVMSIPSSAFPCRLTCSMNVFT
jgi:hypothetical protein